MLPYGFDHAIDAANPCKLALTASLREFTPRVVQSYVLWRLQRATLEASEGEDGERAFPLTPHCVRPF
jgi:hypothetical protein